MFKFLKRISFYYLIPFAMLSLVVEIALRYIPNDYSYKNLYLSKNAKDIELLILGTSHSFRGLNPAYFSFKTFNLANVSQSLNFDILLLNKYKNELSNLKFIVLPISYSSLEFNLKYTNESWRLKNYNIYYQLYSSLSPRDYFEVLNNSLPYNMKRIFSYYINNQSDRTCDTFGWSGLPPFQDFKELEANGEIDVLRHTADLQNKNIQKITQENIKILLQTIVWAEQNQIKILLFTPPAYTSYIKHINKQQMSFTAQTASSLSKKYKNVKYINLLENPIFQIEDFNDSNHLSESGATKLSEIINMEILNWLKE